MELYNVILTKVKNDHNRLRDDIVHGVTTELPTEGKHFLMFAEGKEFGTRQVNTSEVTHVNLSGMTYTFYTKSGSVYEVELVSGFEEEL